MTPRYQVSFAMRASRELLSIVSYIRQSSPQNAVDQYQRIIQSAASLDILPHRYEIYLEGKARTIRSMALPPFIIYYQIDEGLLRVHILSIRHGSQRQPKRF